MLVLNTSLYLMNLESLKKLDYLKENSLNSLRKLLQKVKLKELFINKEI